jgi:hypothetical protein
MQSFRRYITNQRPYNWFGMTQGNTAVKPSKYTQAVNFDSRGTQPGLHPDLFIENPPNRRLWHGFLGRVHVETNCLHQMVLWLGFEPLSTIRVRL